MARRGKWQITATLFTHPSLPLDPTVARPINFYCSVKAHSSVPAPPLNDIVLESNFRSSESGEHSSVAVARLLYYPLWRFGGVMNLRYPRGALDFTAIPDGAIGWSYSISAVRVGDATVRPLPPLVDSLPSEMARLDLYVDTFASKRQSLVTGAANPAVYTVPELVQGDTISIRVYLLERNPTYPISNPFNIILNGDLSLKLAITAPAGGSSTVYTNQYTWAKDANNQYFYADLPLNTAAIGTLLGSGSTASAWLEIEYTQNAYPTTVALIPITILADGIKAGGTVVPAGETALTVEVAQNTFLKQTNTGFVLKNPNTGLKAFVYLADDGTLKCDPIT